MYRDEYNADIGPIQIDNYLDHCIKVSMYHTFDYEYFSSCKRKKIGKYWQVKSTSWINIHVYFLVGKGIGQLRIDTAMKSIEDAPHTKIEDNLILLPKNTTNAKETKETEN